MLQKVIGGLIALSLSSMWSYSEAESRPVGLSAFAASSPNFPCSRYIRQVNKSPYPIMPVLWGTFGRSVKCINRFSRQNKGRPHVVEVHLENGPCQFHGRCGSYEARYEINLLDLMGKVRLEQNSQLWLSAALEDRFTKKEMADAVEFLEERVLGSNVRFLRSAIGNRPLPSQWLRELHGVRHRRADGAIINNDGTVITQAMLRRYHSGHAKAAALILWTPDLQGIDGRFLDPRKRTFKLTSHSIRLWNRLLRLERATNGIPN